MDGPLVSHRSPEFEAIHRDCRAALREVFRTAGELLIVNGDGNVGLEAAIANCVRPDDTVLCLANGKFGDNLVEMVARHSDDRRVVEREWGRPFDLDRVAAELDSGVDAVAMTHCETSTGLVNPVRQVAELAGDRGVLTVVDGVSSIGGEPLPVDDWAVDLAITASQKCLSAPPGVSVVSVGEFAMDRWVDNPRTQPYNLDFGRYLRAADRDQTPSTAPVHTYRALRRSARDILEIGLEDYIETQSRRARAIRRAAVAMGLEVFPTPDADSRVSNTVTVLDLADEVSAVDVVAGLEASGVRASTGIDPLADRVIRLATMSNAITDADVLTAVGALESVLASLTGTERPNGVPAAAAVLDGPP